MKLTDGERLILVMLSDLQDALKVDGEVDPSFVKRSVVDGGEWAIALQHEALFDKPELPATVVETLDLLSMFRQLEQEINDLDEPDRSRLQAHNSAKFKGFDGNNDPHFGHAQTIINDLGRFHEFKGRPLNSHSSATLPRYRAIRVRYDAAMDRTDGDLDVAALEEIFG